MATKDRQTFYNLQTTTADGKVDNLEYKSENQLKDIQTEAAKVGTQVIETKGQSFLVTTADSFDEILQVVPDADIALGYFNYGLSLVQHNVKRALMRDVKWEGVEGDYDLINDVQTEKEKRVADPMAALKRSFKAAYAKMHPGQAAPSEDEINAVLASMLGQPAPAQAAA